MITNIFGTNFLILNYDCFFLLTFGLTLIGITGIIILRQNLVIAIMAIEIIFLSTSLNFIVSSLKYEEINGQIAAILLLAISAAESAIALSIVVSYYRLIAESEEKLILNIK
jgi:NADH:ubiquinone oxidoreductase subunit K